MKKKILVIEDDQAIVEVVTIILESEGYAVDVATEINNIDNHLKEGPPHMILLDIWLGGNDGGMLAKTLKSTPETKHIPIVIMSASNEAQEIARAAGVDGVLLKPFTIDDLLQLVKQHT